MTKEEQNQIIKDAWVRNLRKENDIPNDIGNIYKNWVIGKVKAASSQLQEPVEQPAAQQQGKNQQEQPQQQ